MAAAVGDQRRKKEAMELLVTEIAKGEDDRIAPQLRTVIEVSETLSLPHTVDIFAYTCVLTHSLSD